MRFKKEKKELLKADFIKMYNEGKNIYTISKKTGYSRVFIASCLKNIIEEHLKIAKVYKRKDNAEMRVHIPNEFLRQIGISSNTEINENVEIYLDKEKKEIIIKKQI